MKSTKKTWLMVLALPCLLANAAPDAPAQLAELTARNVSMVSSALAAHQTGLNDVATTRAAHIASINRLAIDARQASDREIAILKQTGGAEILKVLAALCEHGDAAALVSGQAEAAEAAAKADVAAAYTPLAISTDKLDRAAKTLATLAKEQTTRDRLTYLLQFAKDVRDESEKLAKDGIDKKAAADQKAGVTAAAAAVAVSASAPASK